MNQQKLIDAIKRAKEISESQKEFKNEIFTSILTVELLRDQETVKTLQVNKPISLQELMNEKKPKNDVETTLIFGYYIETILRKETFNTRDITECYKKAKEKIPPNVSDKIKMNVQNGWMMPVDKKGALFNYTLTRSGIKKIENGLNSDNSD